VRALIVGHTAFTLAMFGLMWAVQVVIYPQFRSVAPANFAAYAADHSTRITMALAVLAPAEVVFAGLLWLNTPEGLNRTVVFLSGALLAAGWISTAVWFGPFHGRFLGDYDLDQINLLIRTNWFRTLLWSARAGLASWFLWQFLAQNTALKFEL